MDLTANRDNFVQNEFVIKALFDFALRQYLKNHKENDFYMCIIYDYKIWQIN